MDSSFFNLHSVTLLINTIIGLVLFLTNPRRVQNQCFLLFTVSLSLWGLLVMGIMRSHDPDTADMMIRLASAASTLCPVFFHWLFLAVKQPEKRLIGVLRSSRVTLVFCAVVIILTRTKFFLTGVDISAQSGVLPEAHYGPGFILFALFFPMAFGIIIYNFYRVYRVAEGVKRLELQFILIGASTMIPLGIVVNLVPPLLTGSSQSQQFGPLSVVAMNIIIAYGIATRRILGVAVFVRRMIAYSLLCACLTLLYLGIWWLLDRLGLALQLQMGMLAHLLAALIVAFSMAPANGYLQRLANRLFLSLAPADTSLTMQRASALLQTVTTLDGLLGRFAQLITDSMGTERIVFLNAEGGGFRQIFPKAEAGPLLLPEDSPLIREVAQNAEPLVLDLLQRPRQNDRLDAAAQQMRELAVAVAVGIRGKGGLEALLLLGPRLSGRIYSAVEQDTLQLLANQLAVAVDNARLYTQVQDGKIYNDLLLDHLVNGVIAVNAAGQVNVFNREAQRVTRLPQESVLGQPFQRLPAPLAAALHDIWGENRRVLDREIQLSHADAEISLRAGGAVFTGHAGARLGALLVFSDITDIKRLELQIRRSDRLASIGTLSAGMAHEIKNPLVALKTFAQLLPERYDDEEFRTTFAKLALQEIERIDGIVNQLLEFSRPAKPLLVETSLHDIIRRPLKLVSEAAYKKQVVLETHFDAPHDSLLADVHQLQQAILNFLLNALDALAHGGRITLTTSAVEGRYNLAGAADAPPRPFLKLDIADTGCGIPPDMLLRIFDPFFTTKSSGTGLGLTVAYGIIHEHDGNVEVESRLGQGTTFHIFFPSFSKNAI
jgi:nitrogen-specific signal transduction histidine kinase